MFKLTFATVMLLIPAYYVVEQRQSTFRQGDGDSDYFGGGLHMRYKWHSDTTGDLYAEGSLRYGRVTTDFNTSDLQSEPAFRYDSGSNYYGVFPDLSRHFTIQLLISDKNHAEMITHGVL